MLKAVPCSPQVAVPPSAVWQELHLPERRQVHHRELGSQLLLQARLHGKEVSAALGWLLGSQCSGPDLSGWQSRATASSSSMSLCQSNSCSQREHKLLLGAEGGFRSSSCQHQFLQQELLPSFFKHATCAGDLWWPQSHRNHSGRVGVKGGEFHVV